MGEGRCVGLRKKTPTLRFPGEHVMLHCCMTVDLFVEG